MLLCSSFSRVLSRTINYYYYYFVGLSDSCSSLAQKNGSSSISAPFKLANICRSRLLYSGSVHLCLLSAQHPNIKNSNSFSIIFTTNQPASESDPVSKPKNYLFSLPSQSLLFFLLPSLEICLSGIEALVAK